jgi:caffeoyl-CoA O-methyltransferase
MAYLGRFDGSESKHASPAMAAAAGVGSGGAGHSLDPTSLPTSTKWSVLSSRVEGLVAELSEVVGKQDAYCVSQSNAEGPAMKAVREKMLATPWGELWDQRQTMFSYGEEMSTDPLEAMLLKELTYLGKARRVLEIGMFVGYGSVAMLESSSNVQVVSLEIDPYLKGWLTSCLEDFPKIRSRHQILVGPAMDSLPNLSGKFDMVFVDANKAEYKGYVELLLKHDLLSPLGMIVCDNILYNGYPYSHSHFDAQPLRRGFGDHLKIFNQWVADHPKLEQVVLPIRDGISLIRQRAQSEVAGQCFVPGVTDYYTFPPAPYALLTDIFLREKGIDTETIKRYEKFIDLPNLENRCDAILEMNPHGTVPFFKMEDGSFINETVAMCEYMEEVMPDGPSLMGKTAQERAVVRMWQRRMEEHYVIPAYYGHRNWTSSEDCEKDHFMRDFFAKRLTQEHGSTMIPHAYKDFLTWAQNRILWLERVKREEGVKAGGKATEYIAGDFMSVVDISVYVPMWFFSEAFPYPPQMILQDLAGQVPWVQAWYDRMHGRPAVVAARAYRQVSLDAYEARKEKGEKAPNAAVP